MSGPLGFDTGSINSRSAAARQLAQMLPYMQSRAGPTVSDPDDATVRPWPHIPSLTRICQRI